MQILLNYDSDKKIPTYGFGGVPMFPPPGLNQNGVSHFFPCSGDWGNCEGDGVNGVFGLYNYALHNCRLSGNFCEKIKNFDRAYLFRTITGRGLEVYKRRVCKRSEQLYCSIDSDRWSDSRHAELN
jgi:hypothetical protein